MAKTYFALFEYAAATGQRVLAEQLFAEYMYCPETMPKADLDAFHKYLVG